MAEDALAPEGTHATAPDPFLLSIEENGLYLHRLAGVAVVGRVVRGVATAGAALDLVGFAPVAKRVQLRAVVLEESFTFPIYLVEGVAKEEIHRGQVLATPDTKPGRVVGEWGCGPQSAAPCAGTSVPRPDSPTTNADLV